MGDRLYLFILSFLYVSGLGKFLRKGPVRRVGCRNIWVETLGKYTRPGEDVIRRTGWRV